MWPRSTCCDCVKHMDGGDTLRNVVEGDSRGGCSAICAILLATGEPLGAVWGAAGEAFAPRPPALRPPAGFQFLILYVGAFLRCVCFVCCCLCVVTGRS